MIVNYIQNVIKYLLTPHLIEIYGIYPIVLREIFSQLSKSLQNHLYFTIAKLLITLIFIVKDLKCELSESHLTAMIVIFHCIFHLYYEFNYKQMLQNIDKLNLIQQRLELEQQGINLEHIPDRQSMKQLKLNIKQLIFAQFPELKKQYDYSNFLSYVIILKFINLLFHFPFNYNVFQYFQEVCDKDLLNVMVIIILSMLLEHFILICFFIFLAVISVIIVPILFCLLFIRRIISYESRRRQKRYLKSIPSHQYRGVVDTSVKEDKTCCICLQEYVQYEYILQLPCNGQHQFHERCVRNWFNVSHSCPICRQQFF